MRATTLSCVLIAAATAAGHAPVPAQVILSAQTPAPGGPPGSSAREDSPTGAIRGRVVRADTGGPLEGARVIAIGRWSETAITDESGRFELSHLSPARYDLLVTKTGFVSIPQGRRAIDLAAGQVRERIELALHVGAVIAGTVLDETGEPLSRVRMWLGRQIYRDGERHLTWAASGLHPQTGVSGAADLTDDLGQFRLFGIMPGTYYVAAAEAAPGDVSSSRSRGGDDAATLFPGTLQIANATPIVVRAGDHVGGLSFALRPVRRAAIRGFVSAADGQRHTVSLTPRTELAGTSPRRQVRAQADGSFEFRDLPPGTYGLLVRDGEQVAAATLTLDGEDAVVPLTLTRGWSARGRVIVDGGSAPTTLPAAQSAIALRAVDSLLGAQTAVMAPDWTFEVQGLHGAHRMAVGLPEGWVLKSIERDGIDITDTPIDAASDDREFVVTVTQRVTTVAGRVRDARGDDSADAHVMIFADDAVKWGMRERYVRRVRPDITGRFTVRGLPPGRYVAVALDDLETGEESNPDVLERWLRAGTRLMLAEGGTQTIELRVERVQ